MEEPSSRFVKAVAVLWRRTADFSTATWLWGLLPSSVLTVIAGWLAFVEGLPKAVAFLIGLATLTLVLLSYVIFRTWRAQVAFENGQELASEIKPIAERRRDLISRGRNMVHRYITSPRRDNFHSYMKRERAYLDILPHLSEDYLAWVAGSARTARVTADGSSAEAARFLGELNRLEKEWGLS